MPLGPYKDWDTCILAQRKKGKSKESAAKICGFLEKRSKGKMTEDDYNKAVASMWMEDILNSNKE